MKRVLVDFAGIGDLVMLVPLLRRLARDGELDLITRPYGPELFAGQPFVSRVFGLAHPNRGRRGLGRLLLGGHRRALARTLRAEAYDEIFTFKQERPLIDEWVRSWSGGARWRVMDYPEKQADRIAVGLRSQGFDPADADPVPRLEVDAMALAAARQRLAAVGRRVVGVQVGSGPVNARWKRRPDVKGLPPAVMAGLVSAVLQAGEADAAVFTGTNAERDRIAGVIARIDAAVRARVHDWSGRFRLRDVPALLQAMQALISVDTGPAHMAAAVGCPLLVCFGPSDPAHYGMRGPGVVEVVAGRSDCQYCAGTPRFRTCTDNRCMQSITLEQLVGGWRRLLRQAVERGRP